MPALTKKKLTLIGLDPATSEAPQVNKAAFIYIFVIPFFSRGGGEGCCDADARRSNNHRCRDVHLLFRHPYITAVFIYPVSNNE